MVMFPLLDDRTKNKPRFVLPGTQEREREREREDPAWSRTNRNNRPSSGHRYRTTWSTTESDANTFNNNNNSTTNDDNSNQE